MAENASMISRPEHIIYKLYTGMAQFHVLTVVHLNLCDYGAFAHNTFVQEELHYQHHCCGVINRSF